MTAVIRMPTTGVMLRQRRRMWILVVFVWALVGLGHGPAHAEPPSPSSSPESELGAPPSVTLEALLQRWLKRGKEVEAWRSEIGAAEFDIVTASLLPNPSIGFETMGTFVGRDDPPDGVINFGARIEMELPIFGQRRARRTTAMRALDVTQMLVATLVWERAADIREAAVERAFADAEVELAQQALAELAEVRRVIVARADAGVIPRYDAMRVEILHASLEADGESARVERDLLEARLVSAVADPTLDAAPVRRDGLPRFTDGVDETSLVRRALEHRPDLLLERRAEQAKLAEADEHRIEARPTPSLFVGTYIARNDDSVNLIGGLAMPLPMFDRNQGLQGRAKAEARGHADMARALEARVRAEVRGAVRNRRQAKEARERFEASGVLATVDLLERAWRAYQGGLFTIAELLDAYQAVWDSRQKKLQLDRSLALAEADLLRATGRPLLTSS
jgi:outer membrane protein, heavy metal efflux system